jgi:hypothetical protein
MFGVGFPSARWEPGGATCWPMPCGAVNDPVPVTEATVVADYCGGQDRAGLRVKSYMCSGRSEWSSNGHGAGDIIAGDRSNIEAMVDADEGDGKSGTGLSLQRDAGACGRYRVA